MLDSQSTVSAEGKGARTSGKEFAIRRRYQRGCLFIRGRVWVARWREDVITPGGTLRRRMRREVLGSVNEIPSRREAQKILDSKPRPLNQARRLPQFTIPLDQFVREQWEPATLPTLRAGSARYYGIQLRCHLLPAFGATRLCDITRVKIQAFLRDKRNSGLSGSSVHGMRTALSKVLQAAVDWNFLEQNPARGIRIGDRGPKTERLYLNSSEVLRLLAVLPEPCHTIVLVAVLTGMRIGEILALRWKYLDLLRGSIQIRETVSEGRFGSPKTRSSRRDIPMSDRVRKAFEVQRAQSRQTGAEDLVFATRKQTPLNPKNLLRRVLRPTCEALNCRRSPGTVFGTRTWGEPLC